LGKTKAESVKIIDPAQLALSFAEFCNKIGTNLPSRDVRFCAASGGRADIDQRPPDAAGLFSTADSWEILILSSCNLRAREMST
jgi:hypothetical protein